MKGIVFTEFIEMVEDQFGAAMVDRVIEASNLANRGAYTAVGTYDFRELLTLVTELSRETDVPVSTLVQAYGKHLMGRFVEGYPAFFEGVESSFDFLRSVENHIHVEVRKLYPEAELPTFACEESGDGSMTMVYRSTRPFADLAEGLMTGCFEHFGEDVTIERENLSDAAGSHVRFMLKYRAQQ